MNESINPRHILWYRFNNATLLRIIRPFVMKKNNIRTKRYKEKIDGPYIIFYNHVSDNDFFAVYNILPFNRRYIVSESVARTPLKRFKARFFIDPIFRRKGENADEIIEGCRATLEKGICVAMTAEGEETPNGCTAQVRKRTGEMVKNLDVDIVTIRLEGGYFSKPTWTYNESKCPMYGGIVGIHKKEELRKMSPEEINELIFKETYVNNYEWIKRTNEICDRKNRAEFMEGVLFRCPKCDSNSTLKSSHDTLMCTKCGYSVDVDEHGLFIGNDVVFDNIYDWDIWQKEKLKSELPKWKENKDAIIAEDKNVKVGYLENNNLKTIYENADLSMNYNEIIIKSSNDEIRMKLDEIDVLSVTCENVNILYKGKYYVVTRKVPSCMRRYRYIRKIIQGSDDY